MKLDTIHHIAIIGHDYAKTREFYVDKLGFEQVDEHHRPDKQDILFNVRKGNLTLEIFIKPDAPKRPALPNPEHTGLRHLAFQVTDVEKILKLILMHRVFLIDFALLIVAKTGQHFFRL